MTIAGLSTATLIIISAQIDTEGVVPKNRYSPDDMQFLNFIGGYSSHPTLLLQRCPHRH